MKNKIEYINLERLNVLKQKFITSSYYVELDGESIQTEEDWLYSMAESFQFPVSEKKYNINWFKGAYEYPRKYYMNWARYEDWMSDLDWLKTNSIILIINNFSKLLINNNELKDFIIKDLKENILLWWENDVINCVVDGKRKSFNVYLVD
ncbi:MAG: hypothetical protein NC200_08550 [Candidatus Gastranaerophilales bacterium]|nr:hypothetical protein [Candidatus Gastranaerophilales bacterium]